MNLHVAIWIERINSGALLDCFKPLLSPDDIVDEYWLGSIISNDGNFAFLDIKHLVPKPLAVELHLKVKSWSKTHF